MAATTVYDVLFAYGMSATADYVATTLSVKPQTQLHEIVQKNQVVNLGDDGSIETADLGDGKPICFFVFGYTALSASDAGTVFDFWTDSAKANGMARSFKFAHPTDTKTYVCYFACDMDRVKELAAIWGYGEIRLRVKGYST